MTYQKQDAQTAATFFMHWADKHGQCVDYADEYAEPGYSAERGILFANWNDIPKHIANGLERRGFDLEWSDEWLIDYSNSPTRAVRSSPDSYGWRPRYLLNDWTNGEVILADDIEADEGLREEYVEEYLLNNQYTADTFGIDLTEFGFTELDKHEHGFYPGQNDTPQKAIEAVPTGHDYVFQIDDVGQFDVHFSLWIRPDENQTASDAA